MTRRNRLVEVSPARAAREAPGAAGYTDAKARPRVRNDLPAAMKRRVAAHEQAHAARGESNAREPITAAIIGGSVISALGGLLGGRSAARSAERASRAAVGEQRRQFDQTLALLMPQIRIGDFARNMLAGGLYGYGQAAAQPPANAGGMARGADDLTARPGVPYYRQPGQAPAAPGGGDGFVNATDRNALTQSFFESPGYQYRRQKMREGVHSSQAARGMLYSGPTLTALQDREDAMASDEWGRWLSGLFGLAGAGGAASGQAAGYGQDTARGISNTIINAGAQVGAANRSAYEGVANAATAGLQNWLVYDLLKRNPGVPAPDG